MTCTRCGATIDPGSAFCANCGARVPTMSPASQKVAPAHSPRPFGVVAIAVLTGVSGLTSVVIASLFLLATTFGVSALQGLAGSELGYRLGNGSEFSRVNGALAVVGVIFYALYLIGALQLVSSYGVFTFQPWAPRLTIVLWIIGAVISALQMLIQPNPFSVLTGLFQIGMAVMVVSYFGKSEVKALY